MAGRARRSERIAVITRELVSNPGVLYSLNEFTGLFETAKSTISEDIGIIKTILRERNMGRIQTFTGVAGGVRYTPFTGDERTREVIDGLCSELADPERILPGGFIFISDIVSSPRFTSGAGEIFATRFFREKPDYVLTMETKGIPVALMTARAMNLPLVVARRQSRVTEGSVVSINYVSGSSEMIQTMSLPRRALPAGSRVLFIDDFMRAGGTARGVRALLNEFEAELVGIGVLIVTSEPGEKLVSDYTSLTVLREVDPRARKVVIEPASWVAGGSGS